jgi:hypothetical protein
VSEGAASRPAGDPSGGEVGTLLAWWDADDHSEWRWRMEFYTHV